MNNLITEISWDLNDYCKAECSYCPTKFRGGLEPAETKDYIRIANLLIDSYKSMGRSINWTFNGGEPLDMNDIVTLLKLCRENGNSMTLHTNGGSLWMDWWAIEPYVDTVYLTYHYWQNPALIKYIINTFQNKQKELLLIVPIRPDHFDKDMDRAEEIEKITYKWASKLKLYNNGDFSAGLFNYQPVQLAIMQGTIPRVQPTKPVEEPTPIEVVKTIEEKIDNSSDVKELKYFQKTTWDERYADRMNSNPSYAGRLCNVGIERLHIGHTGWVRGSDCNNQPMGNIWHEGWMPPTGPQVCGMQVCESESDRKITKF